MRLLGRPSTEPAAATTDPGNKPHCQSCRAQQVRLEEYRIDSATVVHRCKDAASCHNRALGAGIWCTYDPTDPTR